MNLRETLLAEHSRAQCDKVVAWVGHDQKRFDDLFKIFLSHEYRAVQRSASAVSNCVQHHPEFIKGKFLELIKNVTRTDAHGAVKRNTVRLLQHVSIPEKFSGEIMNMCFDLIQSPAEKVAVKAFSLTVLENLSEKYPEIIPEIKMIIEDQLPLQTAAFKSRAEKFLRRHP